MVGGDIGTLKGEWRVVGGKGERLSDRREGEGWTKGEGVMGVERSRRVDVTGDGMEDTHLLIQRRGVVILSSL